VQCVGEKHKNRYRLIKEFERDIMEMLFGNGNGVFNKKEAKRLNDLETRKMKLLKDREMDW